MKQLTTNQDHNDEKFWSGKGGEFWRAIAGYSLCSVVTVDDMTADRILQHLKMCEGFAYYARDGYGAPYLEEAVIAQDIDDGDEQ